MTGSASVCPKCNRQGTLIVGVKSKVGIIQQSLMPRLRPFLDRPTRYTPVPALNRVGMVPLQQELWQMGFVNARLL